MTADGVKVNLNVDVDSDVDLDVNLDVNLNMDAISHDKDGQATRVTSRTQNSGGIDS